MYCPNCGPSVFKHNFEDDSYTCSQCGNTFTSAELDDYYSTLERPKRREVEPWEWRDAEDGELDF